MQIGGGGGRIWLGYSTRLNICLLFNISVFALSAVIRLERIIQFDLFPNYFPTFSLVPHNDCLICSFDPYLQFFLNLFQSVFEYYC